MSDDVLITPASRKIEFKDSGGNVDGTIQLDSSGNLVLTSSVGLLIGDLDADIHIGDGSNTVDMVFDFAGSIYSAANQDLTIGKKSLGGNNVKIDTPAMMRITSAYGYVEIGPNNASWSHFYTDMPKYYFNKGVIVDEGIIGSYNEDLKLVTDQNETRITVKATDGDVGIGNTAPVSKLHVSGDTTIYNTTNEAHLVLRRDATGTNYGSSVRFEFGDSVSASSGHLYGRMVGAIQDSTDGSEDGYLRFDTSVNGTITEHMRINGTGQVLIGKTAGEASIARKLEVDGTIAAFDSSAGGGVGFHMGNSEGEFLLYTDGGHLVVKDYAGSDTYPFKIEGGAQNDTLVVKTGGDVTVKDDLTVNGHINFDTQHVGGSAGGSTGTENGANTWCKVLSWDPGTTQYRDLSLTLGITEVDVGSQNQAIINVYGRSNGTNSAHTMGLKIISLTSALHLQDDSFKLITEGWGQPIELWMKKYGSYGTFNWNEIAKKLGGSTTLTYFSNSAWQSTEPVKTGGTPAAVRSFGTVIEGRQAVLNLYHNQNVSQLSAGDVLSTISFRKHTGHSGNESIRIYNVQGDSGTSSGASDDYHTSDLRISTRKIGTNAYTDRFTILGQEGHVGIGTMSPTFVSGSGLHIYDSTQANLRLEDAAGEFFDVAMQNGDAYLINRVSDGFMSFRTNGTERFKIDSEGANTMYRNDSTTQNALLKLHEDHAFADNPTLEVITDRTDGAIPSVSVSGGAVTVSGPNGWNTWEKETFYKKNYGAATGQGSGLINVSHNGVGTINSITLPYDAKLRAVVITYTFNTSTSSTTDQTWRLFHSGDPANVVSDFVFDVDNDMTNTHGNFFVYTATGLDVTMNKDKTYSVRREGGSLNIQSAVRFDLWYTRHTGNY